MEILKIQDQKFHKNVLLIFDDCGNDDNFVNSNIFKLLLVRGRHLNISVVLTLQYLNQIGPVCRSNLSYIIIGQLNRQSQILLRDEFCTIDINRFLKLYRDNTKDYNFFVINNNSVKDNDDLNQLYGTIKAE